ncbi:hypothetical protein [Benzoatithermus flavus]|uniref:CRISPR-associated protein Csm4 n=1 Tax=Benzoatithermus flavus TaxID=3108223 RepID=A0ABU8XVR5_9PROT
MSLYRIRLRLEAPLGTGLTSGTLFGHLCWARRARHGAAALERWLRAMAAGDEPPCLVSDGFPAGLLPRPLLPPPPVPDDADPAAADTAKRCRRRRWVRREDWLELRAGLSAARLASALVDWQPSFATRAHNRIDRHTGTTPETAGLWFVDDDWSHARRLPDGRDDPTAPLRDVYVSTALAPEDVFSLFVEIGQQGYGRDATYGRGRWSVEAVEPDPVLAACAGERLMSLSHGCLSAGMAEARWERWTHFGKVGIELAAAGARPFKRPVLLMRPGATWRHGPGPFGALLTGVHQDRPEVVHNAWHLAIPYTEVRS